MLLPASVGAPTVRSASDAEADVTGFGDKAPQLSIIGTDCYAGVNCAKALVEKAQGTDARNVMAASSGLSFNSAAGPWTMYSQHVDKTMYIASCKGTEFEIIKTIEGVKHGETCKAA